MIGFNLLIIVDPVSSQTPYFQQEVNYKINVSLNDTKHELSAYEEIKYINNSSGALSIIYFHLWPNAYKDQSSAMARQILEDGDTKFYYSKPEERGYIDSLDFKVDGRKVKVEYDEQHNDICKLILNEQVRSLDTITITTPFHVKLPDAKFSRMGHSGQAYYVTQWYPKPAVYDNLGWHPIPYLNQGEFYSEFGSFDVSITVPKNYLLAATGDRIDAEEEEKWLQQKVSETEQLIAQNKLVSTKNNAFPPSLSETKTIRFKQSNVHDFAWFADKRFHVLHDQIKLPNTGKEVHTWAYFTDNEASLWKNAMEYINDATAFYSFEVGNYPYNHVTAIDGVIAAGGGMEYPNITIIGESGSAFTLETTIMHEVGHNWFYGMLGSNERDFPAMDEGINSFYEMRYINAKYPEKKLTALIDRDSTFKFFGLNKYRHKAQYYFAYLLSASQNVDQPINTPAADFSEFNYGAIVYCKTATVFDYLMNSVGGEKFDDAMRFYFDQWKFKHPGPKDLQQTLQYYCGEDLKWFIDGLIMSKDKLDYKVVRQKRNSDDSYSITVKNKGKVIGPVTLSGYHNGKIVGQVWYNGFEGKQLFEFPPSKVDYFKIDGFGIMPEINKKNNRIRTRGLFKKVEPLQFNFIGKLDNPDKTPINFIPLVGYNAYNKWMVGCSFYNYSVLQKRFEYTLSPMYAFSSNTPVGFAEMKLNLLPEKTFGQVTIGVKAKSFAYYFDNQWPQSSVSHPSAYTFSYRKLEPFIKFDFKKKIARSKISQSVSFRSVLLTIEEDITSQFVFNVAPDSPVKGYGKNYINELQYNFNNDRTINPFDFKFNFQQNEDFGKVALTANYKITLPKKQSIDMRLFAGTFVYGSETGRGPYRFRASGYNGYQDYLYDHNFVGRNEINGLGFAQYAAEDGNLKTWTPLGQSNTWLAGFNVKSPRLFIPIRIFADVVVAPKDIVMPGSSPNAVQTLYDGGFEISVWKGIFELYIPVVYNKEIRDTFTLNGKNSFFDTWRFTLNLHKIDPRGNLNDLFR